MDGWMDGWREGGRDGLIVYLMHMIYNILRVTSNQSIYIYPSIHLSIYLSTLGGIYT